jgi:uncharacterized hydrophobic protein (TIGR00341 family)
MRLIEVVVAPGYADAVAAVASKAEILECWALQGAGQGRQSVRLLVQPGRVQEVLDALQAALEADSSARIVVLPVEATLPRVEVPPEESKRTSREELYDSVEKTSRLDVNFLLLVALSTVVATVGLVEDNVAVVIGAMVIAPLLGPNLALALATALGDTRLMIKSLASNLAGIALAVALSALMAYFLPLNLASRELLVRTQVGFDSIALALASGAAAALSVTTGLPSVLVGVMVAVALLPPSATLGLMLGGTQFQAAIGAGLLLAVNIVCVNLSAKVVFLAKGIKPRTWYEREKAKQSTTAYILVWAVSLALLLLAIYLRRAPA